MGMSKAALDRCRSLVISDITDEDSFRVKLQVYDPKTPDSPIATYVARTKQDAARVKRAYTTKYRIPAEKVIVSKKDEELVDGLDSEDTAQDTAKDTEQSDANKTDQ